MFYKTKDGRILELGSEIAGEKLPITVNEVLNVDENGFITTFKAVEIIQKNDYLDELFNRIIIVSLGGGRRTYRILTKNSFGKMSLLNLIKDIAAGKKQIYGAIWVYGPNKEPNLKSVAIMMTNGEWKRCCYD